MPAGQLSTLIDGQSLIDGSFNFTKAAEESNAENLDVDRNATRAARYAQNWQQHAQHSEAYQ